MHSYKFFYSLILISSFSFHVYAMLVSTQPKEYYDTINTTVPTWNISRFHVSLHLKEGEQININEQICSGSLISKSVVLTSGRCLYNDQEKIMYKPSQLYVSLSALDFDKNNSFIFNVTNIKYRNNSCSRGDIAILFLNVEVPDNFSSTLYYKSNINSTEEAVCTIQIWNGHNFEMQNIDVSRNSPKICVDESTCAIYLKNYTKTFLLESGGPLLCKNKLIGVLIGTSSVKPGYPILYAKVINHIDWIRNITQMDTTNSFIEFGEVIDGGGDIFGGDDDDNSPYYPYYPYGGGAEILLPTFLFVNLLFLLYVAA